MKKFFYVLLVTLLFVSCEKLDTFEEYEGHKIEFNLGDNSIVKDNSPVTRAVVNGTSFTSGDFGVYGYVTPETNVTSGGYIMKNAKYNAVTGVPSNGQTYYWPKADDNSDVDVKFVAYYPWDGTKSQLSSDNFVYNITAGSENDGIDVLYAIENNVHPQIAKVNLTFKHALSLIQFQAKKASTVKAVKIKSIKFSSNLYTTGQLIVPMKDGTATTSVTTPGDAAEFEFAQTSAKDNLTNSYALMSNVVVIPQNVPTSVTIVFDITLTNHDDVNDVDVDVVYYNRTVTRTVNTAKDANNTDYVTSWLASNKYVYRIYVTPDDVDFTATIADWTSTDYWQIWDEDTSGLDFF